MTKKTATQTDPLAKMNALALPRINWKGEITTKTEQVEADSVLVAVKSALKQVEEQRKEVVDPLNKVVKLVNARAKEFAAPFNSLKDQIETAMLTFAAMERQKLLKEAAKTAKKLEKQGAHQMAVDVVEAAQDAKVLGGESNIGRTPRARITDMKKFLTALAQNGLASEVISEVFEKHLNAMARAGVPALPGVEYYDHEYVRTGGSK